MRQSLFNDVVFTDYGQFDLVWQPEGAFDGDWDRSFAGQLNGLVGAAQPDGVYCNLGRRSGGSRVQIDLLDAEPPLLDDAFDDVVEVSVTVPPGTTPIWQTWAGEQSGELVGLGPGDFRMRVSARGRDAGKANESIDDVVDTYVIELWPASRGEDEILRVGSDNARYWHDAVGNRRSP